MPWITKEGRTIQEAQDAAVSEAGLPESDLDIEVVNEGAKGLFGLGGEPAVVRVRPKAEARDVRHAFHDDMAGAGDTAAMATDDELADDEMAGDRPGPMPERQEEAARLGAEIVRGILERMALDGEVRTRIAGGTVYVEVFGEEMGILIGRSGATLEALQELVRAGVQRRLKTRQAVVVDVEAYWERRRTQRAEAATEKRRNGGGRRRRRNGGRSRR